MSHVAVDWSIIPAPVDDGAAHHLVGMRIPPVALHATDGPVVDLSRIGGLTVLYAYPRTGEPGQPVAKGCQHEASLNVDALPDDLPVPDIALRLRCSACGSKRVTTRPDWTSYQAAGMGRSNPPG